MIGLGSVTLPVGPLELSAPPPVVRRLTWCTLRPAVERFLPEFWQFTNRRVGFKSCNETAKSGVFCQALDEAEGSQSKKALVENFNFTI